MSEDPERYRDLFAPWGTVSVRRMFGGLGIYREGLMFALVADGELYFKTDRETVATFEAAGGRQFVYEAKGKTPHVLLDCARRHSRGRIRTLGVG